MTRRPWGRWLAWTGAIGALSVAAPAVPLSHLEESMTSAAPADSPRTLNTPHLFTPPSTRKAWDARAKTLRAQILFSLGLWPMPKKTPLKPRVTGKIEAPDYTVENVAIETWPGFYLCGNLYRPKGKQGPFPAIANPHGHWQDGRLRIEADVPPPAPPPAPPAEGRGNLVAIGVNLARQGFVVFAYDMVGYNDTSQVSHQFANGLRPWLWGVSLAGLQLWNSIRAVDYLQSLPDVDPRRIGATGGSGGGTQTFLLCAVDERVKAAVPVNMISAHMQGGCLCENGPGLRLGTDNVEIGALMAPRPLLLVAATGDWTKDNPTVEWPAIKKVYDLYGAGERTAVQQFNYGHNYNRESREAMYAWFRRWLLRDSDAQEYREKPFEANVQAMRVWNAQHPLPENALNEPQLIQALIDASEKQLASLWPTDAASLKRFQKQMAPALQFALAAEPPQNTGRTVPTRPEKSRAVLLVSDGEKEVASLQAALRKQGFAVSTLVLEPITMTREALWNDFFTCYNRTPLGDRVQEILHALDRLRSEGYGRVDMVGLGQAGLWALLARGLYPSVGRAVIDVNRFDNTDDQAFIRHLYAPGLRRAGDVRTAALLAAPAPLYLFNTGTVFRTDAIAAGYRALNAPLKVDPGLLSAADIAAWLTMK